MTEVNFSGGLGKAWKQWRTTDKGKSVVKEGLEKWPDFVFPEWQKLSTDPLYYRDMVLKYLGARTLWQFVNTSTNSLMLLPSRGRISFPSPWVWTRIGNSLLTTWCQNWQYVTSQTRSEKTSQLAPCCPPRSAYSGEASSQGPRGEGLRPPFNNQH